MIDSYRYIVYGEFPMSDDDAPEPIFERVTVDMDAIAEIKYDEGFKDGLKEGKRQGLDEGYRDHSVDMIERFKAMSEFSGEGYQECIEEMLKVLRGM